MRNDSEKEVTGCGKINEISTGSVQEKRDGDSLERITNRDRETQTNLNDTSEIDLKVSSLRGGLGKRKKPKMVLKCFGG